MNEVLMVMMESEKKWGYCSMSIKFNIDVSVLATLELNEGELHALNAIVSYGADQFLMAFYKHLGETYLKRHETSLRTLFQKIQQELPPVLKAVSESREVLVAANKESNK